MGPVPEAGIFKPTSSPRDRKSDATTLAVRAINDDETLKRVAKTERLRAARLAREAALRERQMKPVSAPDTQAR